MYVHMGNCICKRIPAFMNPTLTLAMAFRASSSNSSTTWSACTPGLSFCRRIACAKAHQNPATKLSSP